MANRKSLVLCSRVIALSAKGMSGRKIARELAIDRRTIRRILESPEAGRVAAMLLLAPLCAMNHSQELKKMALIFDDSKVSYALEKFADFINHSGSGHQIPGWADAASKVIIDSLRAFEEKLRVNGTSSEVIEYHVAPAIYAVCELQGFVTNDKTDIPNSKAARVYRDFLAGRIEQLREMENEQP
jgi:hypothetical protein